MTKRITSITAISLLALTNYAIGALDVTLSGNSATANWADLTAANYPTSAGYNNFMTNTAGWTTPISADAGSATLDKVAGTGGYPATASIYNFTAEGSLVISNSSPLSGLETLIVQVDLGGLFTSNPVLNYNGGSQALVADFSAITTGDFSFVNPSAPGPPAPTSNFAFQWDLSGVVNPITSYEVAWTTDEHVTTFGIQLDTGDTFSGQAIPEPSTYAAAFGAFALVIVWVRRKFSHQSAA
ncbi:hypothetical protein [Rubellicoccus peritrichatus]|uniref:PEP-CTERM protein-sorting domain-containing protein n=1 Tax=Rubellicoccus peritrichatus TaxID=3080537 RepID=A0AAQ3LF99_9BACT|nr:hypothetical protein [Puniceicoccus sp. CR14]WOO42643.1 hypothetical protein RZN69_06030 [Puniceicoccus sp. CR14]